MCEYSSLHIIFALQLKLVKGNDNDDGNDDRKNERKKKIYIDIMKNSRDTGKQ